jgi:glycine/D-amino acid oxidase-like deaminating enzyme
MRTDVEIIGGGVIGSAAAGFLRQGWAAPEVVMLEPDLTYARAASRHSGQRITDGQPYPERGIV